MRGRTLQALGAVLVAAALAGPAAAQESGDSMILIPAGSFLMGTPVEKTRAPAEEKPQHQVTLRAFRIDRLEVTNAAYLRFVSAIRTDHPVTCHSLEADSKDHTPDVRFRDDPEWNAPEKPVIGVDWFDAYAFCAWSGKRLPTEAEWEKAARGDDGRRYSWGDQRPGAEAHGNFADESALKVNPDWRVIRGYDDGFPRTAPVGSFPAGASPYGVQDMIGNVWEWVNDWYSPSEYSEVPRNRPLGPTGGHKRVLRGGSWDATPNLIRTAVRYSNMPTYRNSSFGFRCARDVPGGESR